MSIEAAATLSVLTYVLGLLQRGTPLVRVVVERVRRKRRRKGKA